ncbi:MAG TPA: hypothetical protein DEA96_05795 [Leptospiraceae bacterium]|nr:hypothetical protein [Spirochaetaceae bacterium]HBS04456.1 hypothetical protein [Leptospiraceae bacterium]
MKMKNRAGSRRFQSRQHIETGTSPEESGGNPENFYSESPGPRSNSRWEEFRVWMHSARGWIYALLLIGILGPYSIRLLPSRNYPDEMLNRYFSNARTADEKNAAYRIGGFYRSKSDLAKTRRTIELMTGIDGSQSRFLDSATNAEFQKEQYETDLLAAAVLRKGLLENSIFRRFIRNAMRRSMARAYVIYSFRQNPDSWPGSGSASGSHPVNGNIEQRLKKKMGAENWKSLSQEKKQILKKRLRLERIRTVIQDRREKLIRAEKALQGNPDP